jgi:hypothetical protein
MMGRLCIAAVLAVGLLASCASERYARTQVNSQTQRKPPSAVQRVLVLASIKTQTFGDVIYRGMEEGLQQRLSECRIASRVTHTNPMEVDPQRKLLETVADFKPDAVLTLVRTSSEATIGRGGSNGDYYFRLVLSDGSMREEYWKAMAHVRALTQNPLVNERASGGYIASAIVEQMKSDGVLSTC